MTDADLLRLVEQWQRQEDAKHRRGACFYPYVDCCGKPWRECNGHPKGNLTIGWGYNLDAGMPEDDADVLLGNGINDTRDTLRRFKWYLALDSVRQAAIVNVVMNMGLTRFLGFERTIAALARGDYDDAARELLDSEAARKAPGRYAELAGMVRSGEWTA